MLDLKDLIFEGYFRDYALKKFSIDSPPKNKNDEISQNIFGLAGTKSRLLYIEWNKLFKKKYNLNHHIDKCLEPMAIKEDLFYEYFGPWEDWLETNCKGKFGLTYNGDIIIFYIELEEDKLLFNLTFSDNIIEFGRL